jgi:hypothetical protein
MATYRFSNALRQSRTAVITTNGTASAEVDLDGEVLCGISTPSSLVGTSLTFTVATASGGTFNNMMDGNGNVYTLTMSTNDYIRLNPNDFVGVQFIKLVSGSTETGGATFTLHTRRFN